MGEPTREHRHPTWLRVVLVGLQAAGVVLGLVLGLVTYQAWSEPDGDAAGPGTATSLPAPVPETPAPEATLG